MRAISASQLLEIWERGLSQSPLQRALVLLAAAYPESSPEALSALPIGQRDNRLISLREVTFGPKLQSLATCPACYERLELNFEVADLRTVRSSPGDEITDEPGETFSLSVDSFDLTFRLPNSQDLAMVSKETVGDYHSELLGRCLIEAKKNGKQVAVAQLPEKVVEAIENRMAAADPQANLQIDLTCPVCEHRWQAAFDIFSFLWAEIDTWAQRILRDVHVLASNYGWHEQDILAMNPLRRQIYLEMILG
jgi:hypothetical protein